MTLATKPATPARPEAAPTGRPQQVVIVTNDGRLAAVLERVVALAPDSRVTWVPSASAALRLAESPETDVVVVDLGLPGAGATRIVAAARSRLRPARCVLVSRGLDPIAQAAGGPTVGVANEAVTARQFIDLIGHVADPADAPPASPLMESLRTALASRESVTLDVYAPGEREPRGRIRIVDGAFRSALDAHGRGTDALLRLCSLPHAAPRPVTVKEDTTEPDIDATPAASLDLCRRLPG